MQIEYDKYVEWHVANFIRKNSHRAKDSKRELDELLNLLGITHIKVKKKCDKGFTSTRFVHIGDIDENFDYS